MTLDVSQPHSLAVDCLTPGPKGVAMVATLRGSSDMAFTSSKLIQLLVVLDAYLGSSREQS